MLPDCTNCTRAAQNFHWGGYTMACARCCARLVRSARPLRHAQEGHFAAIARRPGRPDKVAIINEIKRMDSEVRA